jgi:hypothetical protein
MVMKESLGLTRGRQQQIHQNHRYRCRQTDEQSGSHAGGFAMLAAVVAEQRAGDHGEKKAERYLVPT